VTGTGDDAAPGVTVVDVPKDGWDAVCAELDGVDPGVGFGRNKTSAKKLAPSAAF
jgi:hypothetical protein